MMASADDYSEFELFARELARLGASTAQSMMGTVTVSRKQDNTPVTEADHRVQAALLDVLASRHPRYAILVEETVADPEQHAAIANSEYCWVIDPIDGTRNFARGLNVYAISIGLLHRGNPVAAAMFDASSGRVYSATRGGGAHIDGETIHMEDRDLSPDTVLLISSFRRRRPPDMVANWMGRFIFRNLGSICVHFTWLAAGYAEGAYAPECKLWDLAAGALIVAEAGGRLSDVFGRSIWPIDLDAYNGEDLPIIAATPTMYEHLISSFSESPS